MYQIKQINKYWYKNVIFEGIYRDFFFGLEEIMLLRIAVGCCGWGGGQGRVGNEHFFLICLTTIKKHISNNNCNIILWKLSLCWRRISFVGNCMVIVCCTFVIIYIRRGILLMAGRGCLNISKWYYELYAKLMPTIKIHFSDLMVFNRTIYPSKWWIVSRYYHCEIACVLILYKTW